MDIIEAFAIVTMMVSTICLVAIAMGYPAAHWIGGKLADFLSFLPTEKFRQAPPALGIPASKAMLGDLDGAVAGYEELLLTHPHHHEIHFRLLEIVLGPLAMEEYGEAVLQRGIANLREPREREAFAKLAHELRSGEFRPFRHLEIIEPQPAEKLPPLCRVVLGPSSGRA